MIPPAMRAANLARAGAFETPDQLAEDNLVMTTAAADARDILVFQRGRETVSVPVRPALRTNTDFAVPRIRAVEGISPPP